METADAILKRRAEPDRMFLLWLVLGGALLTALLVSLASGRYAVPVSHVVDVLWSSLLREGASGPQTETVVVLTVRLPRVLTVAVAGAGLAICGAVLQGIFRNPLVGPQTVGASSGAALGGATAILLVGFGPWVAVGAFAGAALALAAVVTLHRGENLSPLLALVLAGVVVSAFCSAIVGLVTFLADPETRLPGLVFWLLGSFSAATWPRLALIAPCTAAAMIVLLGMRWRINVLSLGDEDARALGVDPKRDRLILLGATCLAISAQVAVSGVVGWVGLVVPNLARMIVGADHRRLLPASVLIGATFLVAADTIARTLTPAEIPVGIITAVVGTPVFAWLLRRTAQARAS